MPPLSPMTTCRVCGEVHGVQGAPCDMFDGSRVVGNLAFPEVSFFGPYPGPHMSARNKRRMARKRASRGHRP